MNSRRTEVELNFFNELSKHDTLEFKRLMTISLGAVGKIVYNPQFTVLYCSEGISRILGLPPMDEENLEYSSSQLIHKDDYDRVYHEFGKYVDSKEPFSLKYRIKHADQSDVWIQVNGIFIDELYQGKDPVMYVVYRNITPLVSANAHLEEVIQRYQIFTEFVQECFFDYEITSEEISFYGNETDYQDIWYNNKENILKCFYEGNHMIDKDIEIVLKDGKLCWYHFKAKGIYDTMHHLIRIMGTMKNIQLEKEQELYRQEYEEKLKNKAHYDQMTGLLNRFACEKIMNRVLNSELKHITSVVIDVDNFKEINDLHGHLIGDQVLIRIGQLFKKYCRSNDIAARIGGDEFFLMFIGRMQQDTIRARLQTMHQEIHNIAQELKLSVPVSVSMGVSQIYPEDQTFNDIYVRADATMYTAKLSGKNTLICFGEDD